ncbi:unnamed protein product, partial [marine sediment metagenome]
MSLDEIGSRIKLAVKKRWWRRRKIWSVSNPVWVEKDNWKPPLAFEESGVEYKAVVSEAERYVSGEYTMLNIAFHEPLIDWHRDPQTGKRSALTFGLDIDYRDPELVGNVRNVWEKNRHHHLSVLALAYTLTKE